MGRGSEERIKRVSSLVEVNLPTGMDIILRLSIALVQIHGHQPWGSRRPSRKGKGFAWSYLSDSIRGHQRCRSDLLGEVGMGGRSIPYS